MQTKQMQGIKISHTFILQCQVTLFSAEKKWSAGFLVEMQALSKHVTSRAALSLH